METLAPWLPWILGILIAFVVLRFVVGIVLRLLTFAVLILVAYWAWRALNGA
ncbi:hypothetical protein [Deinococcus peraridilitoris]|uniref:Uncharacterized protein n=1 Tax=Deinococcus peraridilitoris (strain DSM 19664 / LMG 22246 / CIP 109416 / KR-200) TaxID=937777 RepID=K9ZZN3_DEIPD|nr:hypothetical protein [Deinococcus peraridilitoris]AFZ66639.1 hypothetical protein Deipe_1076 [Deinococcus peraridilitoris DSM 19664]